MKYLYPYHSGSMSAKAIRKNMPDELRLIRRKNSKFNPTADKIVINWGASKMPLGILQHCAVYNRPEFVRKASNKLKFFRHMENSGLKNMIPEWTISDDIAAEWIRDGSIVYARTKLNGHSGAGIILCNTLEDLNGIAKGTMYTKNFGKNKEFRLHFSKLTGDKPFSVQQKKRKLDVPKEKVNWKIKNHRNGFIYARHDIETPEEVLRVGCSVFRATHLDFCAVDVVFSEERNKAVVLEVNTAPGIEGSTVKDYVEVFERI